MLWTANTERFASLQSGVNDTADNLLQVRAMGRARVRGRARGRGRGGAWVRVESWLGRERHGGQPAAGHRLTLTLTLTLSLTLALTLSPTLTLTLKP